MRRRTQPYSRRVRRQARTIPFYVDPTGSSGEEEAGKLFRCWNCGWLCNTDRDELGGPADVPGDYVTEATRASLGVKEGDDSRSALAVLGGPEHKFVALESNSDGGTKEISHSYEAQRAGGCPFCGTRNYRGDYP